jgi:DNA helicase HerA-like ATPase
MHTLICGVTQSGKTTLARYIARQLRAKNQAVIVYDPMGTDTKGGGWGEGAIVFDKTDEFLEYVSRDDVNRAHIFADESDLIFSHEQKENHWLLRRGRHFGFSVYCITQRPKMIAPSVRNMCTKAFVFRLTRDDIKSVAADYGFDDVHNKILDAGDFLCFTAGSSVYSSGNVFKLI